MERQKHRLSICLTASVTALVCILLLPLSDNMKLFSILAVESVIAFSYYRKNQKNNLAYTAYTIAIHTKKALYIQRLNSLCDLIRYGLNRWYRCTPCLVLAISN